MTDTTQPLRLACVKLAPEAILPKYATAGAACFDLHSIEDGTLSPDSASSTGV